MADPPPVTGQVTDAAAPSPGDAQAALYATLSQSLSVALQNIVAQQQQIIVLGQTAATAMRALLDQPNDVPAASSGVARPPLDQASIGLIREVLATSPASAVLDSLITVMTANSIVNFETLAAQLQNTLLAHATLVRELQQLVGEPAK